MVSLQTLQLMDDGHAINALRADFDPVVNTTLEGFLIDWLARLMDERAASRPFEEIAENHDMEPGDFDKLADALINDTHTTVALLGVISAHEYDTPDLLKADLDLLKADLDLLKECRELVEQVADPLTRLTNLIKE